MSGPAPVERAGVDNIAPLLAYLHAHCHEAIFPLHDLTHLAELPPGERPTVLAYMRAEQIIAVQCLYASGRWLPHFSDQAALPAILADASGRRLRWAVGAQRVMAPLLQALAGQGYALAYDQREALCQVNAASLAAPARRADVRRATLADVDAVAELRRLFEEEYFGLAPAGAPNPLYRIIAERTIRDGTYLAVADGVAAAAVAIEADIPELTHIGAVYTRRAWRGRGLATAAVAALSAEELRRKERVTLTVRPSNTPAWRAYHAVGFRPCGEYRISRLQNPA
ncbi:MAG: GNAT family N-acetyltransferase [Chloroflexi bacterium]|nr:GNAT family N-acetyltransferase [Chloroflexota bacterium]